MQYRNIYSSQYLSPLHLLCLVHLCDSLVHYGSSSVDSSDVATFCLRSLEAAKVGYPFAGPLQKMFLMALSEYGVKISNELERSVGAANRIGPEDLLDACTRSSYRLSIAQILPNMEEQLGPDFMNGFDQISANRSPRDVSGQRPQAEAIHKQSRMEVGSLLNP